MEILSAAAETKFRAKAKRSDCIEAIAEAGHSVIQENGVFITDDSAAVELVLDSYDEIAAEKKHKILELKEEGLRRIQLVFPAINDFDELDLVREQFLSVAPAARQATVDFQLMIDTVQAGKSAAAAINALTTEAEIQAYDVVNSPAWP